MANQEEWVPFMDVSALLIFGVVLFPNVDGLVDLAAIDVFLTYHHSKESPVVAVLANLFDTFDRRCEKSSARKTSAKTRGFLSLFFLVFLLYSRAIIGFSLSPSLLFYAFHYFNC